MQKYFDAVKQGHSFTIMKRSKPVAQISRPAVDEWGDEGHWTNFDFRDKKHPNGVPMDEFISRLEEYNKNHG
jgi:antitoxin (DNA-binding transcriptional repressor) of toxin-antitoxin stability system